MGEQFQHCLYEFGPFCVDTRERVLLRDGRSLTLTISLLWFNFRIARDSRASR